MFVVEEATKGDRGALNYRQEFVWEQKNLDTRTHSLWVPELYSLKQEKIQLRKICSTNFLNETVIDDRFAKDYLFDMETFDFYDICVKKGVKMFSCVRFVTDHVAPLNKTDQQLAETTNQLVQVQADLLDHYEKNKPVDLAELQATK